MCNPNFNILNLYNFDTVKNETSVETEIFKVFLEKLKSGEISIETLKNMSDVPTWFYVELYDYIQEQLRFDTMTSVRTLSTTNDNLHNYSIAKTYKLFSKLKEFDNLDNGFYDFALTYSNSLLNNVQAVEDNQVQKTTETYSILNNSDLNLKYQSREDSKVRPAHEKCNGVILPASNSWWASTGLRNLGAWNCRCSIIRTTEPESITYEQRTLEVKDYDLNSKIDLKSEKVLIFNEKLPLFDVPPIIRKQFRPKGF